MENLYDDPYIIIEWQRGQRYLEYRWKKFVPSQKFKELLNQVYDYMGQYQCKALLADLSQMQVIPQDVQTWIETDWFPRMLQKGVKTYAMVRPTSALANMSMDNMQIDENEYGIKNGYFQNLNQAKAWLDSLTF